MKRVVRWVEAKLRACRWLSCLQTPRSDVLWGTARWRWLYEQRHAGRAIDPTVEVRCRMGLGERIVLGTAVAIDRGCILWAGESGELQGAITLGDGVRVGPYSYLGSLHRLEVGSGSLIGSHCYVITANHGFGQKGIPLVDQGFTGGDIRIGEDVWLGSQSVVLPGVRIGDGAVVAAGAVVTKSIPKRELWGGVPARKIRDLYG